MLSGDYLLTGQANITQMDLDPFIISVLHLNALTGHSRVDGQFTVAGALLRPETLTVDANLSSIVMDFEHINLQNAGPVKFQYGDHMIRVDQANLRGMDTDFRLSGSAGFAGEGALDLHLAGAVNLSLFGGFVPNLDASGPAQVDASFTGTLASPSIDGRGARRKCSRPLRRLPGRITSQVTGDFVFDASRLVFDNITSQTGGGNVQLAGSVTYGNGPLRYDLTARADQVRVRYPVGMSWLTGGTLRIQGTAQSSALSGRITVDRLLLSDNFDFGSLLSSSTEGAPDVTSGFLRNLQLDVQIDATPNMVLQWSSGTSQSDGSVRLRGTWQRPILLGNVHLLTGQMTLSGNQYGLSRGDINFVNPFRLDPVLNIEATTTIQRYEVTVDFTGTASHLTMTYRSDPPLPSSDIISLLALGQTGQESQLRSGPVAAQTTL